MSRFVEEPRESLRPLRRVPRTIYDVLRLSLLGAFLAENELSALYVPSKLVARLHPAFAETAMFLATQIMDEARHIEVTADLARRTRLDESRHVRFGIAHVRHALSTDPSAAGRLESAVRRRAAALHGIDGVPAPIQDALTAKVGAIDGQYAVTRVRSPGSTASKAWWIRS